MNSSGGKSNGGTRMSALWGTGGKRGDGSRNHGRGRSALVTLLGAALLAVLVPIASSAAGPGAPPPPPATSVQPSFYIPSSLLSQASASPADTFDVIVQGDGSASASRLAAQIAGWAADANNRLIDAARKADDAAAQAQNAVDAAAKRLADAQTALARAQADAAAKSLKALQTGRKPDQDAAVQAAQRAAAAAQAVSDAQQTLTDAQSALAQATAAATAAHAAVSQLADKILRQQITDRFSSITGVAATLTGDQIMGLVAHGDGLLSITPDAPVQTSAAAPMPPPPPPSSSQLWPFESKSADNWVRDGDPKFVANMPSIAIVDSGIQNRSDFGNRIVASVDLSTLPDNSPGDGRGHGTFVAGIAAGAAQGVAGADPAADLVDIDVMDDTGMGLTSDIINACQWILNNKAKYNIRVANFSLHSTITAPFYIDPLDRAVEQLWFNGITVVAAAGNYGTADGPSGVVYSPGDDPFVITVGAADLNNSRDPRRATIAPWSAWGSTIDGFAKPELSAPGRYMIGPVPTGSTLVTERPANVTSPGYMQLSGTSFAAPVVAGAAANILAQHPTWTPDQVKGALMVTAIGLTGAGTSGGVGVIQAKPAVDQLNPPNPNLALDRFVSAGGTSNGVTIYGFDSASWNSTAKSNSSWDSASWNSASWNSASWNSASWNSASWNSASWNSASWNSASWNSASWNSASWNTAAHEDAAEGDAAANPDAFMLSPDDIAALLLDPDLAAGAAVETG
jgi:serine protease AprX